MFLYIFWVLWGSRYIKFHKFAHCTARYLEMETWPDKGGRGSEIPSPHLMNDWSQHLMDLPVLCDQIWGKQTNANGLVMFIASSPIFTDPRTPEKDLSAALEVVAMSTEVKTWVMNRFEFKSQISYLNIGWGWLNDISCHNISIINWNKIYIYIPYCSHLWLNIVKWLNGNIHQPGIFIPNVHDLQPEISYPIISQTWIHSILFMKIFHQLETVRYFNGRLP